MCKIELDKIKQMQIDVRELRTPIDEWRMHRIKVGYKPETDEDEEYTEYIEGINAMRCNCESMLAMVEQEFYKKV